MLRRSFLPMTESHDIAASALSIAADALIAGDIAKCREHIRKADLRSLREYFHLLAGPINPDIHRQKKNPVYSTAPGEKIPRMPNAAVTRGIFARDGYRCRFCGTRVILKQARKVFTEHFPEEARWESSNEGKHFGLSTLTASIDHLVPYKRGGTNDLENLVTACGPCQFGRNRWLLEEVEIESPFKFPPIVDEWDGLGRLVGLKIKN